MCCIVYPWIRRCSFRANAKSFRLCFNHCTFVCTMLWSTRGRISDNFRRYHLFAREHRYQRYPRCMVLIGSHLGENMHNGQVQEMSDAIDKGATIITVDPRFSTAASKSKYWLPIKPATDLALLLSWMNVLIENEWYDKAYVERYTQGFEELKEHVKSFTPEWAYGIATIDPNIIRETAREMHNASPSVIINPGRHVTWYGDDYPTITCSSNSYRTAGIVGTPRGGYYKPEKLHLPTYPVPPFPGPEEKTANGYGGKYSLANEVVANGLCDATIPTLEKSCNYKAWLVNGTNLLEALPDGGEYTESY